MDLAIPEVVKATEAAEYGKAEEAIAELKQALDRFV